MGLDMYLYKRISGWDIKSGEVYLKDGTKIELTDSDTILKEVMYWRKQWDIHEWFKDNAEGCEGLEYEFKGKKLKELIPFCLDKIKDCEDEFDLHYYDETINVLSRLDDDEWYTYEASW